MLTDFILPGISLGLSATSIPGPLQAYLINITLRYGWRRGLLVVLSPLITDVPIIALVVFLLGQLPPVAIQVIRLVGGLLLLWIAWGAWQQYRSGANFSADTVQNPEIDSASPRRILGTAVLMNAVSPGPYLFWATVNGPLLLAALDISLWHAAGFLLAFYGTFLSGMTVLVFVFNRVGQMDARITRLILLLTIALLLWFGTALIAEAVALTDLHRAVMLPVLVVAGLLVLWREQQTGIRTKDSS